MLPLLLAIVTATGGDGVPDRVVGQAQRLLTRALEGVDGDVALRLFRTRTEMERAVHAVDPRAPVDFGAYYHYGTKTVFAYLAPRPDPALWEGRLTGVLQGALAHEAQHARGHLRDPAYRRRPAHGIEGEADRDAVAFLRAAGGPGAGAWELQLESTVWRARARGLLDPDGIVGVAPGRLPPAQRATWYATAYARARGPGPEELPWVLWRGAAEPSADGYRVMSEAGRAAVLIREAPGPLDVVVTPLAAGKGQVDLVHGFKSMESFAKIAFLRRGGVRAMWREGGCWRKDALHPAPALAPGRPVRLSLRDGRVSVDGRVVLHVRSPAGKRGVAVFDGAADVRIRR